MGAALRCLVGGMLAAGVADVRTAIDGGVRIEDFTIVARVRNAKTIPSTNHWSRIEQYND